MKYIAILFFIPILCYAGNGNPTPPDYFTVHKPYSATGCPDAETQQEVDQCSEARLLKVTKQVEIMVEALTKNYKINEPKLEMIFIKAQKSWNNHMKLACDYQTYYSKGGSGYQSILNACKESQILERISYLHWMLDSP